MFDRLMQSSYDYSVAVADWINKKFNQKISVEKLDREEPDEQVIEIDHWIYITPAAIEKHTIRGIEEIPGLMVQIETVEHNYPREPDWVDVVDVQECTHASEAVKRAFGLWFESMLDNAIETHSISRMIEEEKDEQENGSEAE